MRRDLIKEAVKLGNRMKYAMVATADAEGLPHVAASRKIASEPGGGIVVSEWFCPGTLANLRANPRVSIVIWDPDKDSGYQILGVSEKIEDISMMDGYSRDLEKGPPLPQVERKIHVHVDRVIHFSHAPHSDMEE
jgi:uncharacterized protein